MIKKSLAAVALVFVIIFAGSQSNVAEASDIYIGEFDSYKARNHFVHNKAIFGDIDGYLASNFVSGNYDTITCYVNVFHSGSHDKNGWIGYVIYNFKRGIKNNWTVQFSSFGINFRYDNPNRYSYLTTFESNLLNYILDNYE